MWQRSSKSEFGEAPLSDGVNLAISSEPVLEAKFITWTWCMIMGKICYIKYEKL